MQTISYQQLQLNLNGGFQFKMSEEGHGPFPPVRARKPKPAVEQPTVGGHWNSPSRDTPCPKTKMSPHEWQQGPIMIRSNLIPIRWVTHKLENNNTKEVLPLLWRFRALHQASQPGDPAKGWEIPRKYDFEGQWDLIIRLPHDWGKQRLHS